MEVLLLPLLLFLSFPSSEGAREAPPKVQIYSHYPGRLGLNNILICHATGFHPPEIHLELLRDRQPIPGAQQSDLAFNQQWKYHLTKHAAFTPQPGEEFSCRVTFQGKTDLYVWDPDS